MKLKKKIQKQQEQLTKRVKGLSAEAAQAVKSEASDSSSFFGRSLALIQGALPAIKSGLSSIGRFVRKHPVAAASIGLGVSAAAVGGGILKSRS